MLSKHIRYLNHAGKVGKLKDDQRTFYLGAVGIRDDGVMVSAYNAPSKEPCARAHAEARLVRKLSKYSIVYVTRIARGSNDWALAKPCNSCMMALRRAKVKKIYYTIGPGEYGVINL